VIGCVAVSECHAATARVSFVRGACGNNAAPVAPAEVTRLRAAIHR